ncbi:hypothetical protein RJT34_22889 [Clitoria ternatea]|uniref:Uncharacterized protein n=1 Tax=Clitoria ternatea TaxID=43366 RepID=A0AAN9IHW2_CLITE
MAEYGYTFRSISSYNTTSSVRGEPRAPVLKPFAPFVPKVINGNPSEGYVTKKTIVPVASKPYGDERYHDDDDDWNHRQASPVRGSPRKFDDFISKVHNEASRSPRSSHVASPDWRHSSQPTSFNGSNKAIGGTIRSDKHDGYNGPNYGYGNKEGTKPIGGTIKNDQHDGSNGYGDYGSNKGVHKPDGGTIRNRKYDGYSGTNGYGDYGKKEGHKMLGSPAKKDSYDGYYGPRGYSDDYGNKEGHKLLGSPVKDKYDSYNGPKGYGEDHSNKEGHKLLGSPVKDKYDGYNGPYGYGGDYGNKEGHHKLLGSPVMKDKYGGYNGPYGYGDDYGKKEMYKPIGSPIKKEKYDGYSNGFGGGDYGNREGPNLMGSPYKNDNYSGYSSPKDYGGYEDYNNKERSKPLGIGSPTRNRHHGYDDNDYGDYVGDNFYSNNKERYKPSGNRGEPKLGSVWTAAPRKGTQLSGPVHDIEKAMELLRTEGAKRNGLGNNGGPRSYENDNHNGLAPSMGRAAPQTSKFDRVMNLGNETERLKNIVTGRGADHRDDTRRGYGTIDHKEAMRKFNGMTL